MTHDAPQFPAGPCPAPAAWDPGLRDDLVHQIAAAPAAVQAAVAGLTRQQLGTYYRNWTIRQITHHLADSHLNCLVRFKWALTEEQPTIKAYDETDWAETPDAKYGDIAPALALLEGVHAKWTQVLQTMQRSHFERGYHHPQSGEDITLWRALHEYVWHTQHHTGQIIWLRRQHGWSE
jgi:hypothetical protein